MATDPSPDNRVGRCGDRAPLIASAATPTTCCLPHGHAGWHRSDDASEWTHGVKSNDPLPEGTTES